MEAQRAHDPQAFVRLEPPHNFSTIKSITGLHELLVIQFIQTALAEKFYWKAVDLGRNVLREIL